MTIKRHLARLTEMNALAHATEDLMSSEFYDEFCYHQEKVVTEYLPTIQALVASGVIKVCLQHNGMDEVCDVDTVYTDGWIGLNVSDLSECTTKRESEAARVHQLN